ncbi:AraC family transcriptional regulator [Paenibacillus sp. Leaf72]|uniref:AraC family transcriptional regulator n=1 Tax=Paenibacillus sp. Leaf72 TaxID=1736234 RepID=UPI001F267842|nr:AraC family transcriptional regulator [Paenibacillus sp. Leaf72]
MSAILTDCSRKVKMLDFGYRIQTPLEAIFHSHTNYEVYYFHEGKCNYLIGDQIYHMQPGDMMILFGMTLHCAKIDPSVPYVRTIVHFEPSLLRPLLELPQALNVMEPFEELRNHRLRLRGEHKEEAERLLAQMHVHQQRGDAIGSNRLLLAFVDLLYFIFGLCEQPLRDRQEFSSDKEQTVQRIISLLEHSYTDDLHMEQLEERLHLSKSYIARLFKDVTGVTVFHYVYRRRINEAKIMFLMEPSVTVTEACYRLGFKHLAHFSRMFKQFVGVSPEQFKRRETQG